MLTTSPIEMMIFIYERYECITDHGALRPP